MLHFVGFVVIKSTMMFSRLIFNGGILEAAPICRSVTNFLWNIITYVSCLQMSEEISPSEVTLRLGRLMALGQAIAVGPCTLMSAVITCLMCGPCCIVRTGVWENIKQSMKAVFSRHMTIWGGIWLFIIVILPAGIIFGSIFLAITCILTIIKGFVFGIKRYASVHVGLTF